MLDKLLNQSGLVKAMWSLTEREKSAMTVLTAAASSFAVGKGAQSIDLQGALGTLQNGSTPPPWLRLFARAVDSLEQRPVLWQFVENGLVSTMKQHSIDQEAILSVIEKFATPLDFTIEGDSFMEKLRSVALQVRDRVSAATEMEVGPTAVFICQFCNEPQGATLPRY